MSSYFLCCLTQYFQIYFQCKCFINASSSHDVCFRTRDGLWKHKAYFHSGSIVSVRGCPHITSAAGGGGGGQANADDCWRGGAWQPPKLADVICGQPQVTNYPLGVAQYPNFLVRSQKELLCFDSETQLNYHNFWYNRGVRPWTLDQKIYLLLIWVDRSLIASKFASLLCTKSYK